jgi:uncharacterized protein
VIPVKLRIDDITGEAKEISFTEPESDINRILEKGPLTEFRVEEPIRVDVSYYRAGTELFFEGDLQASTTAICARCAEEFAAPSGRDFRFILAPKSVGFADEKDIRDEDLEFSLYDGDQIDLSPLIREQFLLSLPTRPLCSDDCRGLCPKCGVNLNHTQCECSEETGHPGFAALRNLKVGRSS